MTTGDSASIHSDPDILGGEPVFVGSRLAGYTYEDLTTRAKRHVVTRSGTTGSIQCTTYRAF